MRSHKILKIAPLNTQGQQSLSRALGISKILAQLLLNRGIHSIQQAEKFLKVSLADLLDPFTFRDMPQAVKIIQRAAEKKQRVMVFGDYDVDGVTSLALLKNTLKKMGLEVFHYIPHRVKDGYGLNRNILQAVQEKSVGLMLTVDCGTNNFEEIGELRSRGVEVIITDHHELSRDRLPQASATINPKLKNCPYAYKDLAGVGVAYKLCQALTGDNLLDELGLVSLGTIADVVPLTGENRIIAKEGLVRLSQAKRAGIKALIEVSRIKDRKINSTFVSYILGPRINASGRVDSAETALNLLLSRHAGEAEDFARAIDTLNRQRQKIENEIMQEAQAIIEREVNFKEHKVIVLAKEGWHQGVLGIVAAKLADKFYRPTIVISLGQDYCKGSGRSIKNFHLFSALLECKDHLKAFGGHSHAVGLSLVKENIEEFRKQINSLAKSKLSLDDLLPTLEVDMEVGLDNLSEKLAEEIKLLEPFGTGNPEPLFFTRNLKLKGHPQVLGRETLKFWVSDGQVTYPAIGFGMASFQDSLKNADAFDLVYTPQIDDWQGKYSLILEVKDIFFR